MSIDPFTRLNRSITQVETTANMAGCCPIVGIVSGYIRSCAGIVQGVAGAALTLIGYMGQLVQPNHMAKWERLSDRGLEQMLHGGLNFARGTGEWLLGCTLIGSMVPLALQAGSRNKFAPIIKYEINNSIFRA